MKKIVFASAVSIILGLGAGWLVFHPLPAKDHSSDRKVSFYRDPMNPQITSPVPKKASDGMDFVPVYEEQSAGGQKRIAYYKDPMHPWFTSDKPGKSPDCGMDMVPVYEGESDTKGIKIDPVTVQNIGVQIEEVERHSLNKVIRTSGKVDYDERKVYSVNSKIMGWVDKLYIDFMGKVVRKGEPLMELYSPELVTTQEEYLQALKYQKTMVQSSLPEARKGSDDLLESARRRLLYWDIPEAEIKALEVRGAPKKTMTIYSPVAGIVMDKMVRQGQNVMAGMELYKIADLSTMWVLADIYQYELPWVKLGQDAEIEPSYLPGKAFKGKITFIYPYMSEDTKTAKVRIEVPNTSFADLKPDMFATVKITSPVKLNAIAIPDQAVIRSGERNIVVIALGGGYFEPREVKLGVMSDGYDQVLDGVKEGEKLVTSSQFLIDSESNLKAAISQMSGHEGMDMSKPMEEGKPTAGSQNDSPSSMPMESPTTGTKPKMEKNGKQRQQDNKKKMDDMQMELNEQPNSAEPTGNVELAEEKTAERIDPVCGMEPDPSGKYKSIYVGKPFYFCSEEDMQTFKKDPEKYAAQHDQQ